MAEGGTGREGQQRRGLVAKLNRPCVAHGKNTARKGKQRTPTYGSQDDPMAESGRQQLAPGDPTPLESGDGGDLLVTGPGNT